MIPSTTSVDDLLKRIARVTGAVTNKDVLAINLSPLPRYQGSCCVVTSHGLQGCENPGTLNTLLREIGVYMGRSGLLHRPGHADVVVSPMGCVGPAAFSRLLTCKDNVHPNGEFLMTLALTILSIRKLH